MMLGMTKRVIVDRGSFFLPTPFPHQLADCATRGINGSTRGDSMFVSHAYAYAGVAVDTDAQH